MSTLEVELTASPPSAEAPASVYVEPSSTTAGFSPMIVIIGADMSGLGDLSSVMSLIITAGTTNKSSC